MAETEQLSEKIRKRLDRHRDELAERQQQIDSTMKEMLDQRERFATAAHRLLESIVHPKMVELSRQFDNAVVSDRHSGTDFHCSCEFSHTPRFPASVTLDIGLFPGETDEGVTVRSTLDILPTLMEYKRNDETTLPLEGSDEAVGRWVEAKILEFVDTYLRLETHPLYQKDYIVVDLVCGMPISATAAPCRIELHGRALYFCSEHCKDAYLKEKDA
ncbi:YHS domain-containing protein [Geobacter grbiciae]|uniref:YHS domain-containing protein n=1 Tax=Geobacter grbiciae TaxID=155042 RepID=UPI001C01D7DA|nr:YHS domain-containing protein [Geobacter grbiciae]MBT1074227.1 YHS domain-containing protein [Geobacter grbiciae]